MIFKGFVFGINWRIIKLGYKMDSYFLFRMGDDLRGKSLIWKCWGIFGSCIIKFLFYERF